MGAKEVKIEDLFAKLEELLVKLEDDRQSLEESFACYEEGMKLVKTCAAQIGKVEKKIQVLSEESADDEG